MVPRPLAPLAGKWDIDCRVVFSGSTADQTHAILYSNSRRIN